MNVIDTLVVMLKLDGSGFKQSARDTDNQVETSRGKAQGAADAFTKGRKQNADDQKKVREETARTTKEAEASAKRQERAFRGVRDEILGLLTAFTAGAGIVAFADSQIRGAAATGRLAANLGIATEELSAWEGAVKKVGGQAVDADSAIQSLVTAYRSFQDTGTTGHDQDFAALGVDVQTLKDPIKTLQAFSAASQRMSKQDFTFRMSRLGIPVGVINLLEKGPAGLAALIAKQKELGVVSAEEAARAQEAQTALSNLGDASSKLGRILLTDLVPIIVGVTNALTGVAQFAQAHPHIMEPIFAGAVATVTALNIALGVGLAKTALPLVVSGLRTLIAPITWLVATAIPEILLGLAVLTETALPALSGAFLALGAAIELTPVGWILTLGAALVAAGFAAKALYDWISKSQNPMQVLADLGKVLLDVLTGNLVGAVFDIKQTIADRVAKPEAPAAPPDPNDPLVQAKAELAQAQAQGQPPAPGQPAPPAPGKPQQSQPGAAPVARAPKGPPAAVGSGADQAVGLIAWFEKYRANAYFDRNAYRAGYGSDTTTDAKTGQVRRVTSTTTGVSRADADADLNRRVRTEFMPAARKAVGGDQFDKLPAATQAAITSTTYNYGHTPDAVVAAARTGDAQKVSAAIIALAARPGVQNPERRAVESAYALQSAPVPTPAAAPISAPIPAPAASSAPPTAPATRSASGLPEAYSSVRYDTAAPPPAPRLPNAAAPASQRPPVAVQPRPGPSPAPEAPSPLLAALVAAMERAAQSLGALAGRVLTQAAPAVNAATTQGAFTKAVAALGVAAANMLQAAKTLEARSSPSPIKGSGLVAVAASHAAGARLAYHSHHTANDNRTTVTQKTEIGSITVNTAATDANGIAGALGPAVKRRGVVAQANRGLS